MQDYYSKRRGEWILSGQLILSGTSSYREVYLVYFWVQKVSCEI